MAKALTPSTWQNGFQEASSHWTWEKGASKPEDSLEEESYTVPPAKEVLTSQRHNHLGLNYMRTWPTLYDGTNSSRNTIPSWWNPSDEVDVLICGGMASQSDIYFHTMTADR